MVFECFIISTGFFCKRNFPGLNTENFITVHENKEKTVSNKQKKHYSLFFSKNEVFLQSLQCIADIMAQNVVLSESM